MVVVDLVVLDLRQRAEGAGFKHIEFLVAGAGFAKGILLADAAAQSIVSVAGRLPLFVHFDELVLAVVTVVGVE